VLYAIYFRENGTFLGSAKFNEEWYCFGKARHPLCSPENYHERSEKFEKNRENLRKFSEKQKKNWRNRPALKAQCLDYLHVLGFMARCESPWEFFGLTGHFHSLLEPLFRTGWIFWLEILQISTLRARYRAEHYNVANATVSTIGEGGEAHVAYEDGNEENLTKEDLQGLLDAYGKELFKEIVNGILPAFEYHENRLTRKRSYMFKCEPPYLICELLQLQDTSCVAERSFTIDLVARLVEIEPFG
jgi:hypothetical protein